MLVSNEGAIHRHYREQVAEWNRPRQKENVLLQSRELVAASFIHSGATKKSQSPQKLDYRDIAACAAHRRKVR
jgi:hypothetical protein